MLNVTLFSTLYKTWTYLISSLYTHEYFEVDLFGLLLSACERVLNRVHQNKLLILRKFPVDRWMVHIHEGLGSDILQSDLHK